MYQDIIFPNDNEEDFIETAKKLGYTKLIFAYREPHQAKEEKIPYQLPIDIAIEAKHPPSLKKQITLYKATPELRNFIEKGTIDIIYALEELEKKDKIHYRLSGINHVLSRLLHEKKITVGFSFSSILNAHGIKRGMLLGRMKQNVHLCRKYKVQAAIASFAESPYQMRSPKDLISFGAILGMTPEEAKNSLAAKP